MEESKGVIYILTNPSFPDYIKIGYANDMGRRLKELNRSECTPFAFRVYATYDVDSRLSDVKIHSIIDKLNPNLRSIDNFDGQKRIREFYAMSPEDAYMILEAIAEIHNRKDKLKRIAPSKEELEAELTAEEISYDKKERLAPFAFSLCGISEGAQLVFWPNAYTESEITCVVVDDKHVNYDGDIYSLTALAQKLLNINQAIAGPRYFKYKQEWLNDLRRKYKREEP